MAKAATIFLTAALIAPSTHAGSSADPLNALNNMAMETVQCAAYFGVISVAMENSNRPDLAKKYSEVMMQAIEHALIVTEKAGLKPETVQARMNMASAEMMKRINNNTSNISILMNDYNALCIEVMTDVEKRGRYWAEQGAKRLEDQLEQRGSGN